MTRKSVLLAGIMLFGLALISCRKKDSQDLFKEKTDSDSNQASSVETVTSAASNQVTAITKDSDAQITKEPDVTLVPNYSITSIPEKDSLETSGENIFESFYYKNLTKKVIERIQGKSYKDNCDVPYEELRYVRVLYWGFDEKTHNGELIVNKSIAKDIVDIFKELYDQKYPIERMVLVDEYDADDEASMAADNTSCFNYRNVDGTDHLSLHSYGLAIDINPLYNPYVRSIDGKKVVTPKTGKQYSDRSVDCSYYINKQDPCYKAFIKRGFTWGGEWIHSKDYQHFQKSPD